MAGASHFEIERKLLIRFPDIALLSVRPQCAVWRIAQTYLVSDDPGMTRRVRPGKVLPHIQTASDGASVRGG